MVTSSGSFRCIPITTRHTDDRAPKLGGRVEGVPADDVIGGSIGFRRPGYAVSIEPGLTYVHGRSAFSLGVPVAVYRNRTRSVADRASGGHGDAAFADYIFLAGFSRLF
jgi:hypothetical protein